MGGQHVSAQVLQPHAISGRHGYRRMQIKISLKKVFAVVLQLGLSIPLRYNAQRTVDE